MPLIEKKDKVKSNTLKSKLYQMLTKKRKNKMKKTMKFRKT